MAQRALGRSEVTKLTVTRRSEGFLKTFLIPRIFISNQLKIDERAEPPPPSICLQLKKYYVMEEQGGHGRRKEWSTAAATVSAGSTGCVSPFTKRRR